MSNKEDVDLISITFCCIVEGIYSTLNYVLSIWIEVTCHIIHMILILLECFEHL